MCSGNQRQILSQIAMMASRLRHESTGELRELASEIKAAATSGMIVRGWATVNCARVDNTVGLDFDEKHGVHIPMYLLKREAREHVRDQIRSVRVTAPLSESLSPEMRKLFSMDRKK